METIRVDTMLKKLCAGLVIIFIGVLLGHAVGGEKGDAYDRRLPAQKGSFFNRPGVIRMGPIA